MILSDAKCDRKFAKNVNARTKLQHLQPCFVQQVSERLDVSFALFSQMLRCTTSVSARRPMGAPAGQHNHCLRQADSRGSP